MHWTYISYLLLSEMHQDGSQTHMLKRPAQTHIKSNTDYQVQDLSSFYALYQCHSGGKEIEFEILYSSPMHKKQMQIN